MKKTVGLRALFAVLVIAFLALAFFATPVAPAMAAGTDCITPAQTLTWGGGMPFYSDSRVHVCNPGDSFKMTINFQTAAKGAYLLRVVPDDTLVTARYSDGISTTVDLLPLLKMVAVTSTSPTDAILRAAMAARGVNITAGEQLPQNTNMVFLGDVPAGASLYFEAKDSVDLRVNRGLLISVGDAGDNVTVDLKGVHQDLPAISSAAFVPASTPGKFAQWVGSWVIEKSKATSESDTMTLSLGGTLIAFTYDGTYPPNGFTSVMLGSMTLECNKVANSTQQLTTVVCRKIDHTNFAAGDKLKVYGGGLFQVWGQAAIPAESIPAGW